MAGTEQATERVLSVRDAAWLCRVNDDTVRSWIRVVKDPRPGMTANLKHTDSKIAWSDLDAFCRAHDKPPPLPAEALEWTSTPAPPIRRDEATRVSPTPPDPTLGPPNSAADTTPDEQSELARRLHHSEQERARLLVRIAELELLSGTLIEMQEQALQTFKTRVAPESLND